MWHYFFHWYDGAVWSNVVADMLWVGLGYLFAKKHLTRIHKRLDTQDKLYALTHKKIKDLHNKEFGDGK